ncbi:MAG: PDZ domain-containing protein [Proteobacteria bacterium]|nr:PDZ domain-containing protein [Pseudomonadota bacterium]
MYPQLADRFKLGTENGAWIQEIVKGGPADAADLQAGSGETRFQARQARPGGDVIDRIGDTKIESENDLGLALTPYEPGEEIDVEIVRDGERKTVKVKLGERPAQVDPQG